MRRLLLIAAWLTLLVAAPAQALEDYVNLIPNQVRSGDRTCITCHNNPNGGAGCGPGTTYPDDPLGRCWNSFGRDFSLNARVWNATLANQDSDGDGFTNGQELQDPSGSWRYLLSPARPGVSSCVSSPGSVSPSLIDGPLDPGADLDGDGYCCIGRDNNNDGDCRDSGERSGPLGLLVDCNDDDPNFHPEQAQICVDSSLDNDCDGAAGMLDDDCEHLVDNDGDGFCEVGRLHDTTDRFCLLPTERVGPEDCDDARASVYPGNAESCFDGLDNNCDGAVDLDDMACSGESARFDLDGDGYCPIGRDLSVPLDGDCADPGEDAEASDCNDNNPTVHPGATEACFDRFDNDCDGRVDLEDPDCDDLVDRDGDGYCPVGRDLSVPRDNDCADPGEAGHPGDCDDDDAQTHPGARENCLNDRDNDCDGEVSLADSDCADFLDADGDGFCPAGWDLDADGNCATGSEPNGPRDCDDLNMAVHPHAVEECTDGIDNDCDGRRDAFDSDCGPRVDTDRDGYCEAGRDLNGDGDCTDDGEDSGPFDCDPTDPTVFPSAGEHCFDDRDNDCNGLSDDADPQCTGAYDADGDGFCPRGRDLNGDGDCLDIQLGENLKVSDCRDNDPSVHPDASEDCFDHRDNDCDTFVDLADADCAIHLDHDGDSFCGRGRDLNGDGDCVDGGERTSGMDCDDNNALVFPGSAEICDDGIDNDCDGLIDLADNECPCTADALCNDGDLCTQDRCSADEQACENIRIDGCSDDADAGDDRDGAIESDATTPLPDLHPRACDCHAAVGRNAALSNTWWLLGCLIAWRRWRRREGL